MIRKIRRIALGVLTLGMCLNLYGCSGGGTGIVGGISTDNLDPNLPTTLPTPVDGPTIPQFNPTANQIPLPNDLLRDPKTGFINQFPNQPPFNAEPFTSLATLQGFSTTGNIIIPFTGGVVPSTVAAGIQLFDTSTNKSVNVTVTVVNPFVAGQHTDSTVILAPVQALKPYPATYVVVINPNLQGSGGPVQTTNLIQFTEQTTPVVDGQGHSLLTGVSDAQAVQIEPLRQFYQGVWAKAEAATGINRSNLVFAFQFGTQPEFQVLKGLRALAASGTPTLANMTTTLPVNSSIPGIPGKGTVNCIDNASCDKYIYSQIFQSTLLGNLTRGQTIGQAQLTFADATATATVAAADQFHTINTIYHAQLQVPDFVGYSKGNFTTGFFNVTTSGINPYGTLNVPLYLVLPKPTAKTLNQPLFPAVIFQHGITRTKDDVFAVAGGGTAQGYGFIAADMPLHGELAIPGTDPSTHLPFASGTGYINLASLRTARDNIRQSVADLFYITQAIAGGTGTIPPTAQIPPLQGLLPTFLGTSYSPTLIATLKGITMNPNFALPTAKPLYLGMSLGSIVGTIYTSVENNNLFAALSVPGGRLGSLLLNSPTFSPQILAGLASASPPVVPGTSTFTQFWWVAQTILDDADPMNYATTTLNGALRTDGSHSTVLIQESLSDTVVPNSATADLVNSMFGIKQVVAPGEIALGLLPQVTTTVYPNPGVTAGTYNGSGLFQYPGAAHGIILDPTQGNTAGAQTQAFVFLNDPTNTTTEGFIVIPTPFPGPAATSFATARDQQSGNFFDTDYSNTITF